MHRSLLGVKGYLPFFDNLFASAPPPNVTYTYSSPASSAPPPYPFSSTSSTSIASRRLSALVAAPLPDCLGNSGACGTPAAAARVLLPALAPGSASGTGGTGNIGSTGSSGSSGRRLLHELSATVDASGSRPSGAAFLATHRTYTVHTLETASGSGRRLLQSPSSDGSFDASFGQYSSQEQDLVYTLAVAGLLFGVVLVLHAIAYLGYRCEARINLQIDEVSGPGLCCAD